MNENSNSHEDVISRFISYGESNFESNVTQARPTQSAAQLGVLRLIYAFRFSGHLRAKLDPLQRPRHHSNSTPPFTLEEFGPVSYTHLRAHETEADLVCRLLLEKKVAAKAERRRRGDS